MTSTYLQKDIKKSKFVATTAPLVTDYMDLVRSNTNYKVLISDLVTLFGASGPLQTKGEITGTPILSVVGGVNYIRNFIDGAGIVSSLSPSDGLKVAHNFTVDKTGSPIMIDESAASPTISSLVAGVGISLSVASGAITIARDSESTGLATNTGGTVTISVTQTPVIIGANWVSQLTDGFTITTGGRFTYTGVGETVEVTASISGQRASAGTDTYEFFLYKNGVEISASVVSRAFTNSDGNVTMVWALTMATNDYIELWIENDTGTADFVVSALNMRLS